MHKHNPFALNFSNRRYLDALDHRVLLFDGAYGTELARFELRAEDFGGDGGASAEGLMELLVLHRPELVAQVHVAYLAAGADVLKTNTFRANPITLREFGVGDAVYGLNHRAARIAREAVDGAAGDGRRRFVVGSMGPSGKLPSLDDPELSDVTFDALVDVYAAYARGLVEGGVDALLLETYQDLLELKAAIHGAWRVFRELNVRVPIQAQVTLDAGGRTLAGPDVDAALATLAALPVDVIGVNCSTGPAEMRDSVRRLLERARHPVSVLPNAGMPENVDGRAVYRMAPEPFAAQMAEFVRWGAAVVGGCCGTGPEHIAALRAHLDAASAAGEPKLRPGGWPGAGEPRRSRALPCVASNVGAVALRQEPRPLLVGERINTQGSRRARRLVLEERYDALVALAEEQVAGGAHVLDVALALTERDDEPATMARVVKLLSLNVAAPLMVDTTDLAAMRAALAAYPGRAIVNSVNLEAGEERALAVLALAREFGAAVVALTIDEAGMAKTAARKLTVAQRLYRLAVERVGLPPHALIFDPLTFTLATGEAASAEAARETLEALRSIKAALPGTLTNLGVSNVSYGLAPPARHVLNSVFLYQAVQAGLDLAIVNPAMLTPYPDVPAEARALAEDLIFNRHPEALARYVAHFEGREQEATEASAPVATPAQRLFEAVLRRRREGVEAAVDANLAAGRAPEAVLNEILLPAMKEVGARFGSGELILPFVLKSAEVMRAAVAHLEPHLGRAGAQSRGTIVLATVFGDVHDIGKNLVKMILANNGYTVRDLGKQVPASVIVDEAVGARADAIGLSALLVATSQQMRRVVALLHERGLDIPVLVGGAAVNAAFAQRIATPEGDLYRGGVYYCEDAFEALQVLEHVVLHQPDLSGHHHDEDEAGDAEGEGAEEQRRGGAEEPERAAGQLTLAACAGCAGCGDAEAASAPRRGLPVPPFWGVRAVRDVPLDEVYALLDRRSLYRVGWGAKGATGEAWARWQTEFDVRLAAMWPEAGAYVRPQAVYGYFPAHAEGDALVLYNPAEPGALREVARFALPRQPQGARRCLADYFAPVGCPEPDVAALQVVTVGAGASERFGALDAAGAYSEAYYVHGLAAQAAEATAAWMHDRIRQELGLGAEQGRRYAWGYPAMPDLAQHRVVFDLLPARPVLGMDLSPVGQLIPEHSTAALVVHHPEARYFVV